MVPKYLTHTVVIVFTMRTVQCITQFKYNNKEKTEKF